MVNTRMTLRLMPGIGVRRMVSMLGSSTVVFPPQNLEILKGYDTVERWGLFVVGCVNHTVLLLPGLCDLI
jgi:hypothetical protein